jgi:Site-specific DNA methylase
VKDIMTGLEPSNLLSWQKRAISNIKRKSYPYLISRMGANTKSVKPRSRKMPCPTIRAFQHSWGHEWANIVTSSEESWKVSTHMTYRLSSFPDKYKKPQNEKLAQVIAGNAVPPLFIKNILQK